MLIIFRENPRIKRTYLHNMFKTIVFSLLVWLCSVSIAMAQQTEFKIISLKHRFANDIIGAIEPMMAPGESVSAIDNHILLRAYPDRIEEIEMLIDTLDQAQKTFKINVSHQQDDTLETDGIAAGGNVTIGNVKRRRSQVGILLDDSKQQRKTQSEQFLRVMDGQNAYIQVGEIVAFTQQWVDLSQRFPQLQTLLTFRDVTSGFAVRPRSIGDEVELEITPRMMRMNGSGVIDFKEVSTVVRVRPNTWVDIGGVMSSQDEVSRMILSRQQSSLRNRGTLRIMVE